MSELCRLQNSEVVVQKMNILRTLWNSPTGLKTTHFWGPAFNWSLPLSVDCYNCWHYNIRLIDQVNKLFYCTLQIVFHLLKTNWRSICSVSLIFIYTIFFKNFEFYISTYSKQYMALVLLLLSKQIKLSWS